MSNPNVYRCSPRQTKEFVTDAISVGLVPFVQSSPGMGKSAIMRSIAQDFNVHMIDHRLSTSAPEDLTGLPRFNDKGQAEFVPFSDLFPIQGMTPPNGKNGYMLFLDEANSAPKSVQAAAYKLVLDRMVGQHHLHDDLCITMAGNLATDRAIVNPLSTAMQSRVVHIEMEINHDEWLQDVALKENYDSRIIAFLAQYPSKLFDFRPDHNDRTFCCPRTWEFMNALIKGNAVTEAKAALYAGTITSGIAVEFIQFTKVFQNMISVNTIVQNPQGCNLPQDKSTQWAVIAHMMEKVSTDNFKELAIYANRFDLSFRILFFRSILIRHPKLRNHPYFGTAMQTTVHYLNGA